MLDLPVSGTGMCPLHWQVDPNAWTTREASRPLNALINWRWPAPFLVLPWSSGTEHRFYRKAVKPCPEFLFLPQASVFLAACSASDLHLCATDSVVLSASLWMNCCSLSKPICCHGKLVTAGSLYQLCKWFCYARDLAIFPFPWRLYFQSSTCSIRPTLNFLGSWKTYFLLLYVPKWGPGSEFWSPWE